MENPVEAGVKAASMALLSGQSMETRGERERRVKEMVREARAKFGTDFKSVFAQVLPKAIALCDSKAIGEKLMFEAYCETLAEMLLGLGNKAPDLGVDKASPDRANTKAAPLRLVVIILIVAALGAIVFWWFHG
jgi:hypothetical protein